MKDREGLVTLLGGFKREKQLKLRWTKAGSRTVELFD